MSDYVTFLTIFNVSPTKSTKSGNILYYTIFTISNITFFLPPTYIKSKKYFQVKFNFRTHLPIIKTLLPNCFIHNVLEKKLYGGGGRLALLWSGLKHFSVKFFSYKLYYVKQKTQKIEVFFAKIGVFLRLIFGRQKKINKKSPFLSELSLQLFYSE